ncbi:MAG: hypothetical protein SNJ69_11890 [Chloroflexaceae bacterium]
MAHLRNDLPGGAARPDGGSDAGLMIGTFVGAPASSADGLVHPDVLRLICHHAATICNRTAEARSTIEGHYDRMFPGTGGKSW